MADRSNMMDRTRDAILNAFNILIEKNDFDKITVQMIIDEAGVGRTTFYRYFKDKYDVMNYNYMRYLQEYLMSGKVQTFEDFFNIMTSEGTEFFRHIQKIFDSNGANSFQNYLYEASFYAVQMIFAMRGHPQLTPTEYLQYSFLCHGIPYLYESWIKGEYQGLTSGEAAKAIYDILPEPVRGNLWETNLN